MGRHKEPTVEILTIEEARERGLTQVVKQLEIDRKTRIGLGLDDFNDTDPKKRGPKKKKQPNTVKSSISKLIRTNFNDLA